MHMYMHINMHIYICAYISYTVYIYIQYIHILMYMTQWAWPCPDTSLVQPRFTCSHWRAESLKTWNPVGFNHSLHYNNPQKERERDIYIVCLKKEIFKWETSSILETVFLSGLAATYLYQGAMSHPAICRITRKHVIAVINNPNPKLETVCVCFLWVIIVFCG